MVKLSRIVLMVPSLLMALAVQQAAAQDDAGTAKENTVFNSLVTEGVAITPDVTVQVTPPAITEAMNAQQQMEAIAKVSGKTASSFIRNSSSFPAIKIEELRDSKGQRVGTRLDFWFVAMGDLKTVADAGLLNNLVEISDAERGLPREARALNTEEHEARGLKETARDGYEDWYYGINVPVMNQVQLSGIGFANRTRNADSILAAINYLPKYRDDQQFPTVWRHVVNRAGVPSLSDELHPYPGLGGYIKATQLKGENGVFVEVHFVFAQPPEWFGGRDPLASKLPQAIRNNTTKFARELRKASQSPRN